MDRRSELLAAATDYVLEHGLVGLSLRPLAAALGTSDRMLIYHFGSKDELVVAVLRESTERSVTQLRALAPADSVRAAVLAQWDLLSTEAQVRCERTYVEASTLGLFGREPYAAEVAAANEVWLAAVRDHLITSGAPVALAGRLAVVVDAAFMGYQLDAPVSDDSRQAVEDLATAVHLWATSPPA